MTEKTKTKRTKKAKADKPRKPRKVTVRVYFCPELRRLCRARKEKHPLFDQAKQDQPAEAKPADQQATTAAGTTAEELLAAVKVRVVNHEGAEAYHGLEIGSEWPVCQVNPGSVWVLGADDCEHELMKGDYDCGEEALRLINGARDASATYARELWIAYLRKHLAAPCQAPQPNDAWKSLSLASAGINGKVGELLIEAGHDTLGKLAQLMHDHGQWWNKEVKGIGEAGATEVADRFAAFWQAHPEYCAA